MKKLFTFIVGAVVGLGAYAQDFDSGGLYYSVLSPDDKTCAVTGYYDVGPDLVIPESVGYDGEEYTVTEIKEASFRWIYLQSLNLPSTLEKIGDSAFWNVSGLSQVVIPNSVKEIGNSSFGACFNLSKLVLGSSVEVINSRAFTDCPLNIVQALGETPARFEYGYSNAITSNPLVAVSENLVAEYRAAWEGANIVPNIPAESLSFEPANYTVKPGGTVQLNCMAYPADAPFSFINNYSDVITIDDNGLVTADNLKGGFNVVVTAISLNGLTADCYIQIESLEEFALDGLVYAVIPNTANEVALIRYESSDAVVTIPETVENNGNFYSVTTIGSNAFHWNSNIEEVVIPASVKLIREYNFSNCNSLQKVTIADSSTPLELSNYNFNEDYNLSAVYVGRTLTRSENASCFGWGLERLSQIVLGPEVTSLPDYIFNACSNLNLVESKNPVPPVLGNWVFGGNPTIIVPAESIDAYRSAWEQYASNIIDTVDATELSFETEEITIYSGQNIKLPLTVEPEGATVIWSSSNPELVRVNNEGYISYEWWMQNVGEAVITATSLNGMTAECKVTAKHWLTFAEDNVSMTPGSTYQVEVTKPEQLADSPITWNSSDVSVATVDENGLITAVKPGDTEIQATVNAPMDGWEQQITYSIQVEVRTEVISVEAVDPFISVWKENTALIDLIFNPDDQYVNREMTWEIADPAIAEVFKNWEGNYYVKGLEAGTTTITGTTVNGKTVELEVTVKAEVQDINFSKGIIYLVPGETTTLEFTTVPEVTNLIFRYSSNNNDVVTIDENGVITAHDFGRAEIEIWYETPWGEDIWWRRQDVVVGIMPESVRFDGSSDYEGSLNGWTWFNIEFMPDDPNVLKQINWTVDNPEVVYIDTDNSFYGRNFGTSAFRGVAVNGDVLEGTITINGLKILVDGEATQNKEVGLGSEFKLDVEASSDDLLQHLYFASDNPEVATVTQDGIVSAVGYGSTDVRVSTSVDGKYYQANISITVKPSEGIVFNRDKITLTPGNNGYISIIRAENVGWSEVTWTSSDENVVAISWSNGDEAGISYRGPGEAAVTATDAYGNVATCDVTCLGNIDNISFNTNKIYIAPGETFQLEWTIEPEGTGQTIRFESENNAVATVDSETGLVTGVNYGETYIRAIPTNGGSWWIPVQVCNVPESVKFVGSSDYVGVIDGYTWFQIEYTPNDDDIFKEIQWTVDNPEIGYIVSSYDRNYAFCGTNLGRTAFRGVAVNGDVLEGTITIEGLEFVVDGESIRSKDLNLGEEFSLNLKASSDDLLNNVTFTSDNTEVATVTEDGMVTAVGYGSTNVFAMTSIDGKYYQTNIYITVRPSEGIVFDRQNVTLTPYNYQIISVIRAADLNWSGLTWRSSNEDVVRIDWSGSYDARISYVGAGTATVTATDEYGNEATCDVTCLGDINDISFNTNQIYIAPGETFQLEWTIEPEGSGQTIRFESENEAVATVDPATGLVTGVDYGKTYIHAIATNGLTRYLPVQVCNLPESVKFVGSSDYVGGIKEYTWFQIEYTPNDNDIFKEIQWTVDNSEIGYIVSFYDNRYAFYGTNLGTTAFRGVAANGDVLEGTITIEGITFVDESGEPISSKKVEVGSETQLDIAASENLPENIVYTYTSSNTEVATVSEDGVVTAVGPGIAQITVKAEVRQDGRRNIPDGRSFVKAMTEVRENEWQNFEAHISITVLPSEGIAFDTKKLTLSSYGYSYLSILRPENADLGNVTWESSDENVVTIYVPSWSYGQEAQISYVGPGQATVTATDSYGNVATCEVTCLGGIDNVIFNTDKIYVAPEKTFQLKYTIEPEGTGQTMRFESANEAIATVDPETGLVTGVDYGETYIRAIATNGWSWWIPVLVCDVPESVKLVGSTDYKGVINGYTPLQIEYTPDDEDVYKEIKWTVEDPEVGYITLHKNETTHENEYAFFGYKLGTTAFKGVAVNGDVLEGTFTNGLVFDKEEVTLVPGNMEYIKVERFNGINWTELTWESSDENVVTILMSSGNQAALNYQGAGKAIVTATDRNGYSAICYVTGTGILITPAEVKIPTNSPTTSKEYKLEVKIFPATAEVSSILWRSQDTDLVMAGGVGKECQLISKSETGVTKVFATTYVNGYYSEAACEVTVYEFVPVTNITPDISTITAEVGTQVQLRATVSPENASNKDLYWESSDEDVATVDENGLVTIHSVGSVAITAYSVENPLIFATFYVIGTNLVGVDGINEDEVTFDIYNMDGILVKKGATAEDYERLDRGIYLIKKGNEVIKVKH